jgi:hypothetical protein
MIFSAFPLSVINGFLSSAAQPGLTQRTDEKIDLLFHGLAGKSYLLQRSLDLLAWTTLQSLPSGDHGVPPATDPAPPKGRAFCRMREVTP